MGAALKNLSYEKRVVIFFVVMALATGAMITYFVISTRQSVRDTDASIQTPAIDVQDIKDALPQR